VDKCGSLNSEITSMIIDEYGAALFMVSNGKMKLKSSLVNILIKVINDKVYSELIN
jgi:hypothetical protein